MYDFRLFGVFRSLACNPVVESHSYRNEKVALLCHHVGGNIAVHTYHSHILRGVGRDGAESEQGGAGRDVSLLDEGLEFVFSTAEHHSLTEYNVRSFGVIDHSGSLSDGFVRYLRIRVIASDETASLLPVFSQSYLCVPGEVEDYRSRTSAACNVEGPGYGPRNVFSPAYLVVPFGDRPCKTQYVGLLEGICAEKVGSDLSRNHNYRGGVYHCIRNSRDHVGGSRTRSYGNDARKALGSGETLSCVYGSLLVSYEYVPESVGVIVEPVIYGHYLTSRVAEDGINAFVDKRLEEYVRSFHLFGLHY